MKTRWHEGCGRFKQARVTLGKRECWAGRLTGGTVTGFLGPAGEGTTPPPAPERRRDPDQPSGVVTRGQPSRRSSFTLPTPQDHSRLPSPPSLHRARGVRTGRLPDTPPTTAHGVAVGSPRPRAQSLGVLRPSGVRVPACRSGLQALALL